MISSSESAKRLSHQCGRRIDMKNPVSPSKHIEMPNEFPGAAKEERTGSQSRVTDWKMRPQPAPGPSVPQDAGATKSRLRPRNGLVEELPAREYSWKVALPLSTGSHPENPEHRARTTHSCGVHVHVMRAVWEGQAGEFAEHLAQTHRARGPGAEAGRGAAGVGHTAAITAGPVGSEVM